MQNSKTCSKCGTANASQNEFCQSCGNKLAVTGPTAQSSNLTTQHLKQTPSYGVVPIDSLGARLDGWADVIPGVGNKAAEIDTAFDQELHKYNFPQTNIYRAELTPGGLTGQRRPYLMVQSYTGATMAVFIAEFGESLYLSWDMFVRPVIKWKSILIMLGVSLSLSIISQLSGQRFNFFGMLFGAVGWMIGISSVAAILGKVLRNSFWAFFIQEITLFAADDVTAMMLATHKALLSTLDSVGVESNKLRNKLTFKAGRQERII